MALKPLQLKRGTQSSVSTYTPADGEPVFDKTNKRLLIGDGQTVGGNDLGYLPGGTGAVGRSISETLRDTINVKDFGAKGDGSTDDTAAFNAAAAYAGNNGKVVVRNGSFVVSSTITTATCWDLDNTAVILGLPNIPPAATMNTSRLTGMLIFRDGNAQYGKFYYGPPQYNILLKRTRAATIAAITGFSPSARTGLNGMAQSSLGNDSGGTDQSCIAVQGIGLNDNTATPKPVWGGYLENGRWTTGTGPAHGLEVDVYNGGTDTFDFNPYMVRTLQDPLVTAYSAGAGGGTGMPNQASVAAAYNIGNNGNNFRRGIVCLNNALDSTREFISTYARCGWLWYWPDTSVYSELRSDYYRQTSRSDTVAPRIRQERTRATGATVTATQQFDIIGASDWFAFNGSQNIQAGYSQVVQRTPYSGGAAQFGWSLSLTSSSGADRGIEFNGSVADALIPQQDATISLGGVSNSFRNAYVKALSINGYFDAVAPGAIHGLDLVWGATTITVNPGAAYIESLASMVQLASASSITLTGLTTGTWYHVYLYNGGVELSSTAPVLVATGGYTKTGDTSRRYLGSVLANSSTSVYPFLQEGSRVSYNVGSVGSAPFVFSGSAIVATSVDVSAVVPVTGVQASGMLLNPSTTAGTTLRIANSAMGTVSTTLHRQLALINSCFQTDILLTGTTFTYLFDATPSAAFNLRVNGYTFRR